MGIYFRLDTDKSHIASSDVQKFFTDLEELLRKYGLLLITYTMGEEIFEHGMKELREKGYDIINEEVLPARMSLKEKKNYFIKCLQKINIANNKLYIIDGFILSKTIKQVKKHCSLLKDIFESIKPSEIVFVTKDNHNIIILNDIKKNIKCSTIINNKIHDRFWIVPKEKKGILVGTSPNGFSRMFTIKELDINEMNVIFEDLGIPFDDEDS